MTETEDRLRTHQEFAYGETWFSRDGNGYHSSEQIRNRSDHRALRGTVRINQKNERTKNDKFNETEKMGESRKLSTLRSSSLML